MNEIIVKPSAETDIADAIAWNNSKRDGLGTEFLVALDAKIHAVQRNPNHFQLICQNIRRALTSRFPFGVFFVIENQKIIVLAVQHTSRNPDVWR
jgi:toxin ParE1/3/4